MHVRWNVASPRGEQGKPDVSAGKKGALTIRIGFLYGFLLKGLIRITIRVLWGFNVGALKIRTGFWGHTLKL